jgi:quercetin dioxygenase-like cupin family protein
MILRKYRWSKHYESAEEELEDLLVLKNIKAERWAIEGHEEVAEHQHGYDTQFWCVEGSAIFSIDGKDFSLQTGDALDLPANTPFHITAGFSGCACYESTSK